MKTINIGVIGMGWMGQAHSRSYLRVPLNFSDAGIKPRLIICSDNVEARAKSSQELLGFERSTTDWREVIADPDVEAVNICTPNDLHVEIATAAAAAGKHIFCEKPVGRSPAETARVEKAAREAGVMTGVGYNYRWAPMVQHARDLIRSGKLGEMQIWRSRFFSMYGANPLGLLTWRFDSEIAGTGVLGDLLSHVVDMTHMMVGPVKRVIGQKHTYITERPLPIPGKGTHYSAGHPDDPKGPVNNEDYVGALVEFGNGMVGTLEACRTIVGPKSQFAFEWHGSGGALGWDHERLNELNLYKPTDDGTDDGFIRVLGGDKYPHHGSFVPGDGNAIGYEDLKVIEVLEFLRSIAAGRQHVPGFAEALAVAEVCAAIARSWESGGWETVTKIG